jgi:hypothetical protein
MRQWLFTAMVAGVSCAALGDDAATKKPAEPTADNPAVFTLAAKPASVKPGGKLELKVAAKVLGGWHIYAVDKPVGYSQPTKLTLAAPKGWTAAGKWKSTEPHKDAKAELETWVHDGDPAFTLEVAAPADAKAGKIELSVAVSFMCCDDQQCLPPKKQTLKIPVTVAP